MLFNLVPSCVRDHLNRDQYQCESSASQSSRTDRSDCEWSFKDFGLSIEEYLNQYLRLIMSEDYENVKCWFGIGRCCSH